MLFLPLEVNHGNDIGQKTVNFTNQATNDLKLMIMRNLTYFKVNFLFLFGRCYVLYAYVNEMRTNITTICVHTFSSSSLQWKLCNVMSIKIILN